MTILQTTTYKALGTTFVALMLVFSGIPNANASHNSGTRTVSLDRYLDRERDQYSYQARTDTVNFASTRPVSVARQTPTVSFSSTRPIVVRRETKTTSLAEAFARDKEKNTGDVAGESEDAFSIYDVEVDTSMATVKRIDDETAQVCQVQVRWKTTESATGQLIYGTQSQAEVAPQDFSYPKTAMTSPEFARVHAVFLDCLDNTTYYFRIIGFSRTERIMSQERIFTPFTPEGAVASVVDDDNGENGASVLGTIGRFGIPIAFIIFLIVVGFYVVRWIRGQMGGGEGEVLRSENGEEEPLLQIPDEPINGNNLAGSE